MFLLGAICEWGHIKDECFLDAIAKRGHSFSDLVFESMLLANKINQGLLYIVKDEEDRNVALWKVA